MSKREHELAYGIVICFGAGGGNGAGPPCSGFAGAGAQAAAGGGAGDDSVGSREGLGQAGGGREYCRAIRARADAKHVAGFFIKIYKIASMNPCIKFIWLTNPMTRHLDGSSFFGHQKNLKFAKMSIEDRNRPAGWMPIAIAALSIIVFIFIFRLLGGLNPNFNESKEGFAELRSDVAKVAKNLMELHAKVDEKNAKVDENNAKVDKGLAELNAKVDMNNAKVDENNKEMRAKIQGLQYLFVSSQKGQSAASSSALSIHLWGSHIACGTLAYSARLKEAVVITNKHVVADMNPSNPNNSCHYAVTVQTKDKADLPISSWYVFPGDADIAYGRLALPPPIPALNITPRADVVPGLHIWASSVQASGLVALDGRVTSTLNAPYQLLTNVGGMPGFSGTGYVDYAGTLSVVHVGAPEKALRRRSDKDQQSEENLAHFSKECLVGMRLSMSGLASHIDACLDLVSERPQAAPETRRKCVDGWSIMADKDLESPPNFTSSCASTFANRSIDNKTAHECESNWLSTCHQHCEFISSCMSFASGKPLPEKAGPTTREECRSGWIKKYSGYAAACDQYMKLRARNPQALGVAAWVLDDPAFVFVDRLELYKQQCK